jgi:hypothetical protein
VCVISTRSLSFSTEPASSQLPYTKQLALDNIRHVNGFLVTLYSYHYSLLAPSTFYIDYSTHRLFPLRSADQETIPLAHTDRINPFLHASRYSRICKYIVDARVRFSNSLGLRMVHRSSPSVISGRRPMTHVQIMSLPRLFVSSFRFKTLPVVMPPHLVLVPLVFRSL